MYGLHGANNLLIFHLLHIILRETIRKLQITINKKNKYNFLNISTNIT